MRSLVVRVKTGNDRREIVARSSSASHGCRESWKGGGIFTLVFAGKDSVLEAIEASRL